MRKIFSFRRMASLQTFAGVAVGVFAVVAVVQAATTISTNIQTDGTLSATGLSSLNGNASTTIASVFGTLYVGGSATTTIVGNGAASAFSGNITVPTGYSLDTATAAGTLNLGTTSATTINIGSTAATTKVLGNLTLPTGYSLDTATAAGTLNLGTTSATTINIGSTAATISALGNLKIPNNYSLDTASGGTLNLGTTSAAAITVGKSGVVTTIAGGFLSSASSTVNSSLVLNSASNKGTSTMTNGTNTVTVLAGSICTVTDNTNATSTKGAVSGTTLTISVGSPTSNANSDVVSYLCF